MQQCTSTRPLKLPNHIPATSLQAKIQFATRKHFKVEELYIPDHWHQLVPAFNWWCRLRNSLDYVFATLLWPVQMKDVNWGVRKWKGGKKGRGL